MSNFHFETSFWSQNQPEQALPDFTTGFQVLHRKLNQSKVENDEIIQFFKDRITLEEQYAAKLGQSRSFQVSGFDGDDGATLKACFQLLKQTNIQQSDQHKNMVESLNNAVLKPLLQFQDDYKRRIGTSKQAMETSMRQLEGLVKEADRAKQVYQRRCRDANLAEEQALNKAANNKSNSSNSSNIAISPPASLNNSEQACHDDLGDNTERDAGNDIPATRPSNNEAIQLGNQLYTRTEYEQLIQKMHATIPMQDHRVPILGRYQHTSTGENIARFLLRLPQCKDSPQMAEAIGQQLIQPYGVLRLIGQRGNKFIASSTAFYQWRGMAASGDDDNNSVSATGNALTLGGLFERKPVYSAIGNEEPHKKARSEAQRADEAYQTAIKRVDQMRMIIEQSLFAHFAEMEQIEIQRIDTIKQIFTEYTSCLSTSLPVDKTMIEELVANQESLKPTEDIKYIVQQYYVAGFSPKAVLYENYYHGIAHDQIFGVPLSELAKHGTDNTPTFIKRLLDAIEQGSKEMDADKRKALWSTPAPLDQVHVLRTDINISSDRVTLDLLLQQDAGLLVALLRLYLLELPQCLFTFELYDAAHALYSNITHDTNLLLLPLSNLIASLPASHFETLKLLMEHVSRFVNDNDIPDELVTSISQSLGPVIIRAGRDSLTTMSSRMPPQLTFDMIKYYNDIFSAATLQAHADSEKRRQARPLMVHQAAQYATGSISPTSSESSQKKRGGIMSFMRSNSIDDPKWNLGVFRSQQQQESHTTVLPPPTTKHTFTASTITHDSPPLSPQRDDSTPSLSNDAPSPVNEVMFDVADHVTRKPTNKTVGISAESILDDIDAEDGHHDLDPFFDDD